MRFLFFLFIAFPASTTLLQAQKYGTTLGIRLANDEPRTVGLSLEQRWLKRVTMEGILQSDFSAGTSGHLLLKRHYPVFTKRLTVFTGMGASAGIETDTYRQEATRQLITTYGNRTLGADVMIGAELTLLGASVSLDYKPNFNISGREDWFQDQVAFSVRAVLIKDKQRKKNQHKRAKAKKKRQREKSREQWRNERDD